jgi:hypothetical protein
MQNFQISCTFANDSKLDYDWRDLIDLLVGDDAEPQPKYFTIEADGADGQTVRISISCKTGKAIVSIGRKPTKESA